MVGGITSGRCVCNLRCLQLTEGLLLLCCVNAWLLFVFQICTSLCKAIWIVTG